MSVAQPPILPADERRWTPGAWLTLAVAVGYLLAGALYVLAAYRQPSDGWNTTYGATTGGWRAMLNQGGSELLRPGDRILAINGRSVDDTFLARRAVGLEAPLRWQVGETARYTIRRDGLTLDLDVPLVQIPASALPRFMILGTDGSNFAALLCLLFGFMVFLLRPGSVAARLLLLILTYFMGTVTIWFAFSNPAIYMLPPLFYRAYFGIALWPLLFAMITHLILAFPQRVWPLARWPRRTLGLLYGLPSAAYLITMATFSELFYAAALFAMVLAMVCSLIGATVYNLRAARDLVTRAQIRWVGLGFASTFGLVALGLVLQIVAPSLTERDGYFLFLALPLCLGIAILRYRLFDIAVIIRRTLVYSVLTLTLGAVYLLSVVALQEVFVYLTGQKSMLAVVASTLAIAALFQPLRKRIQNIIDRRFFRRKYDAQHVLAQFAQRAQQQADLDTLSADLLAAVQEALEPDGVTLWMIRRP